MPFVCDSAARGAVPWRTSVLATASRRRFEVRNLCTILPCFLVLAFSRLQLLRAAVRWQKLFRGFRSPLTTPNCDEPKADMCNHHHHRLTGGYLDTGAGAGAGNAICVLMPHCRALIRCAQGPPGLWPKHQSQIYNLVLTVVFAPASQGRQAT